MKKVILKDLKQDHIVQEAFKFLRTNIQFCGSDKHVIMLTSCVSGEGKSDTSLSLAMSLAELGKQVILVDTDLRKSVLLSKLNRSRDELLGLTHFLTGQASLRDVVCTTNVPNFHLITAGPFPPNPVELLNNRHFEAMIEALRAAYDYIIVDTAPLGTVIDAAIVAKQCDGAVIVIEAGKINYRFVQDTKAQLEKSGCPVLGAILNKVDAKKPGYGSYGRYGYGKYGKYYGKYYGDYYGESTTTATVQQPQQQARPAHRAAASQTTAQPAIPQSGQQPQQNAPKA